jgi:hypothetical protein
VTWPPACEAAVQLSLVTAVRDLGDVGEDTAVSVNSVRAAVDCKVCELATALQLLAVTIRKCLINAITYANSIYSNSIYVIIYVFMPVSDAYCHQQINVSCFSCFTLCCGFGSTSLHHVNFYITCSYKELKFLKDRHFVCYSCAYSCLKAHYLKQLRNWEVAYKSFYPFPIAAFIHLTLIVSGNMHRFPNKHSTLYKAII